MLDNESTVNSNLTNYLRIIRNVITFSLSDVSLVIDYINK